MAKAAVLPVPVFERTMTSLPSRTGRKVATAPAWASRSRARRWRGASARTARARRKRLRKRSQRAPPRAPPPGILHAVHSRAPRPCRGARERRMAASRKGPRRSRSEDRDPRRSARTRHAPVPAPRSCTRRRRSYNTTADARRHSWAAPPTPMPESPPDDAAPPRPLPRLPARAARAAGAGGLVRYDPLRAYMAEIARHPLLSREEEHELAVRYRETGRRGRRLPARRVEPSPRGEDRPRVPPHRLPAPGPRPGGEHGAHAGGEEVRPVEGREAVVLRRLVDPRVHHPVRHGELADGEARHHPGPAQAVLQPLQGAREAARPRHRADAAPAREEPGRRGEGRRGDDRAHGGRRRLARRAAPRRRRGLAPDPARPRGRRRRGRRRTSGSATSSCAGCSARSSRPSRGRSRDEKERYILEHRLLPPGRRRRRSRCRRLATASSSPASAPGRSRRSSPARLRDYLRAEIPDFELLGPPEE